MNQEALALSKMIPTGRIASGLIDSHADMIATLMECRDLDLYPPREIVAEQLLTIASYALITYEQLFENGDSIERLKDYLSDLLKQEMRERENR